MTVAQEITTVIIKVNGESYPLNCAEFTARECGLLKRIGQIKGIAELPTAIIAGDLETVVAMAVIAARRAGTIIDPDSLLDGQFGNVVLELPESEDPPTEAAEMRQTQNQEPADCGTLP